MFAVWLCFYLLEILNPNNVLAGMEHQHHPLRTYSPDMCFLSFRSSYVPERHRTLIARMVHVRHHLHPKRILAEKLRFQHQRPLFYLHVLGGARTHIIWSGIRYFSCFRTRQTTECTQRWQPSPSPSPHSLSNPNGRPLFHFMPLCRVSTAWVFPEPVPPMGVLMGGMLMITIIAKNWKALLEEYSYLSAFSYFFITPNIGERQPVYPQDALPPSIHRRRLLPVRVENRQRMKELMARKPIGYGIGLAKPRKLPNSERAKCLIHPTRGWLPSGWKPEL